MLVMLEARIRKMLDEQVEIYEETKQLDAAAAKAPEHELEIASGRLARKEGLIVREADRALVLLREDGTSVAFPEAIEQARDDPAARRSLRRPVATTKKGPACRPFFRRTPLHVPRKSRPRVPPRDRPPLAADPTPQPKSQ